MATTAAPVAGTLMPELTLVASDGKATTLSQARANGRAVVYFMRTSTCPVCLRHLKSLVALSGDGRLAGTPVLVVAPGGAAEAADVAKRLGGAGVSAWASGDGHALVGLGKFLALQHSGTLLVGRDGAIEYVRSGTLPLSSFSADELLAALAR